MANPKITQDVQVKSSQVYDDTLPVAPALEDPTQNLEFDLNALRSVMADLKAFLNQVSIAKWTDSLSGSIGGAVAVQNDGILVSAAVDTFNFFGGSPVEAILTAPGEVTIYHPAPTFSPDWPLDATESPFERVSAVIASPSGGEGVPFNNNGIGGTVFDASRTTTVTLVTSTETTGFGGDSTFDVKVYDADGVTVIYL